MGCQYWTYYENEGACFSFVSCSNLDPTDCDGCISGDVECQERQCDLQGQCDGSLVKFDVVASRYVRVSMQQTCAPYKQIADGLD